MKNCFQFENMNMLEHGQEVHKAYELLLKEGFDGIDNELWQWLLDNQYDKEIMKNYHIYHDCGKPACRVLDDEGRQHFPNHAQHSYFLHQQTFDLSKASEMIRLDMHFHQLKADDLSAWLKTLNDELMASLYLSALAEINANSIMFGGTDSTSYKIKKKQLLKAARKIQSIVSIEA